MTKRTIAGAAITAMLALAGCGSDGPKAMSEDDFIDEVTSICETAQRGVDKLDTPTGLDDYAGIETYAKGVKKVVVKAQNSLEDVVPPEDYSRDFNKFQTVIDDRLEQIEEMINAAQDEDADAVAAINDEIGSINTKQANVADDLGIEECAGSGGATPDTTTPSVDTAPTDDSTTLPETTLPSSTVPPLTLPPTVPPVTLPDVTLPDDGGSGDLTVVDLTTIFVGPDGFTLLDSPSDVSQPFIDIVTSVPALAASLDEIGVGVLQDGGGNVVASIVVGATASEAIEVPSEWDNLLCDPSESTPLTTPAGLEGISCPGTSDTGIVEVFSLTNANLGFILASFDASVSLPDLVDGFFAANVG